eukprot:CAMPEP_0202801768 /NCGR_PEP_ID=MMETSP1388-20130828/102305_1 /ASSEMBLY_ACC=CAM_ASM_000864 /TAXON_ID=37098 /ORGANISM="Isochrysis sp, Strain CCMP1244" /LENGTH=265 /DNA_ID=CAMNT_0049471759 /DNA_START=72 /DNA_END=869 /DNA_ORIENTATION=-
MYVLMGGNLMLVADRGAPSPIDRSDWMQQQTTASHMEAQRSCPVLRSSRGVVAPSVPEDVWSVSHTKEWGGCGGTCRVQHGLLWMGPLAKQSLPMQQQTTASHMEAQRKLSSASIQSWRRRAERTCSGWVRLRSKAFLEPDFLSPPTESLGLCPGAAQTTRRPQLRYRCGRAFGAGAQEDMRVRHLRHSAALWRALKAAALLVAHLDECAHVRHECSGVNGGAAGHVSRLVPQEPVTYASLAVVRRNVWLQRDSHTAHVAPDRRG